MDMKNTAMMGAVGTGPAIGVDLLTKLETLPLEVKIDMLLRWGMYAVAIGASLATIISFIVRWKKGKL